MNKETRQRTTGFHTSFHRSSHYFRASQPECYKKESNKNEITQDTNKPSKEKTIDVFEFEPVGFMSHGRW